MSNIFSLDNRSDIWNKLQWNFEQLRKDPVNPYKAMDFFVTSWLLVKSCRPRDSIPSDDSILEKNIIMEICRQVAEGSMQFRVEYSERRERSQFPQVAATGSRKVIQAGGGRVHLHPSYAGDTAPIMFVTLTGDAKNFLGDEVPVRVLARNVMDFWETYDPLHA